jgi:hypothetical protein
VSRTDRAGAGSFRHGGADTPSPASAHYGGRFVERKQVAGVPAVPAMDLTCMEVAVP